MDDYTQDKDVRFITRKDQAAKNVAKFKRDAADTCQLSTKIPRFDQGGDLGCKAFQHFCECNWTKKQLAANSLRQQNGVAERPRRYLMNTTKCTMDDGAFPCRMWEREFLTTCVPGESSTYLGETRPNATQTLVRYGG